MYILFYPIWSLTALVWKPSQMFLNSARCADPRLCSPRVLSCDPTLVPLCMWMLRPLLLTTNLSTKLRDDVQVEDELKPKQVPSVCTLAAWACCGCGNCSREAQGACLLLFPWLGLVTTTEHITIPALCKWMQLSWFPYTAAHAQDSQHISTVLVWNFLTQVLYLDNAIEFMGQGLPGCTAWDTIKIGVRWPHPSSAGVFCLRKGKNPCLILTASRAKQERILSIYLAIETSHFFCSLDQLTGGRMEGDLEKEVLCVCACLSIQQRHK